MKKPILSSAWGWPESWFSYIMLAALLTGLGTWIYWLYRAVAWAWWVVQHVQWYVRP